MDNREPVEVQPSQNLPTEEEIESEAQNRFNGIRTFWKAARSEDRKLTYISFSFFLIVYIYSVTKDLKDAFIIGRQSPASISILKVFWVPPVATIASLIIQKMSIRMNTEAILKIFLVFYCFYFFGYGIFIPFFRDSLLEPWRIQIGDLQSDSRMEFRHISSLSAFLMTFGCWTGTLHFIMSELWGTIILSLLFTQLFNEICWERQFKRFIPVVYTLSNFGLLFSAFTSLSLNLLIDKLSYNHKWKLFAGLFMILGILSFFLYRIINILLYQILPIQICRDVPQRDRRPRSEPVGFLKGLEMIFSTKVIFALCIMVLGYNIVIIMAESSYKSCLSELAKSENRDLESSVLRNKFFEESITALLVISFFLGPMRNSISWFGWTKYALTTPSFALITCIAVLGLALITTGLAGKNFNFINNIMMPFGGESMSKRTIHLEQALGIICISVLKVMKYAAFDIAREYFSKRIDISYRARFRSVYDGICARQGKAIGSLIQVIMNGLFNTMDIRIASLPYLVITSSICISWIYSVIFLGKKYNKSVESQDWVELGFEESEKKKNVEK
ncbi:ATP:ADP Antiporter (AAA) Family [Pseudoloma neurophilia]|uniref:ADP,ATP carrier protein n=1 Tax=Pseudoloma neurophilia TaxID=146866 RepID=A0A0R0LTF1_9MICR|nr:ATP:ADP Antiporter (AAA) Family [Pseudoloma neurophilia]